MAEIQQGQIGEILRRRLMAQGSPNLGDTIQPCIVLEQDRPEWPFLAGELLYAASTPTMQNTPGTVYFHGAVFNPAGSGIVVILEQAWFYHAGLSLFGPSTYKMGRISSVSGMSLHLVGGALDSRWDVGGSNKRSTAKLYSRVDAAEQQAPLHLSEYQVRFNLLYSTNTFYGGDWNFPIVLQPGTGLMGYLLGQGAARNDVVFSFAWRERALSDWEKASQSGG